MEKRINLYRAVWYWDEEHLLTFHGPFDGKDKAAKQQVKNLTLTGVDSSGKLTIMFLENVDQNQQKIFKQRCQRIVKPYLPNLVTLQDIKDVVTFLLVGSVPNKILNLLHSYKLNHFLRTLIVYFQLHLQVWDDLQYRSAAYDQNRLKHPISIVRETRCKTHLSNLRSRAGQEFALLVTGEGFFKQYHHMNNPLNRSYSSKDLAHYEYMIKFTARVVWIALYRSNYKEIEIELYRLFYSQRIPLGKTRSSEEQCLSENDLQVLHGEEVIFKSHWDKMSPLVSEVFTNSYKPELLLMSNNVLDKTDGLEITGLKALLTLPEELLSRFGLTLGILGQPRDSFEVMLHVKQEAAKSLEEQEMERALTLMEQEQKPMLTMNQYLKELETTIDLSASRLHEDFLFHDIREEIEFYTSMHREDSKRAKRLWIDVKGPSDS